MFAVTYFDNGIFRLRTWGPINDLPETRSEEEIEKGDINFNKLLKLDDWTMVIEGFMEPFITACFISKTKLFIMLFYNPKLMHYHFIWDITA